MTGHLANTNTRPAVDGSTLLAPLEAVLASLVMDHGIRAQVTAADAFDCYMRAEVGSREEVGYIRMVAALCVAGRLGFGYDGDQWAVALRYFVARPEHHPWFLSFGRESREYIDTLRSQLGLIRSAGVAGAPHGAA